ncbi:ADP-heptose synthase [Deltaproteobacteria bacterium]|nr:ADP-heptose synthase [Deltaproteobacteria bacterium]
MLKNKKFCMEELAARVDRARGHKVLLIGDVMLDEYLEGDAERISPEAPIPVVRIAQSRMLLGGAGNVARNITTLGGEAHLVSIRGEDAHGDIVQALLAEGAIETTFLRLQTRPTTVKTRVIARHQQMLRIDHEETAPLCGEETDALLDAVAKRIDDYAVVVVSDYGKGVVSEKLMRGLFTLRNQSPSRPQILVDPKTPNYAFYKKAFIMTPNLKETGEASRLPVGADAEILAAGRHILQSFGVEHLLITLGEKGMALFISAEEVWHLPTVARKVFDVTGAGDTVMATLALCLASGLDLLEGCILSNFAAGIVVGELGAATVTREDLRDALLRCEDAVYSRWV